MGDFTWVLGIEDTSVHPPAHFAMAPLDEYDLTEHTEHWRADLTAARDLGAGAVRYGVNWPLVHTAPETYDWSTLDERLRFAVEELGLTVIADLVHYGTPTWLDGSFADPRYPDVVAAFAGAFAARYRGLVDHVTPLNEPVTTASFCGLRGVWPPALTGWDGWVRVTLALAEGITRSVAAIRAANPAAVIVHVEASSLFATDDPALAGEAEHLTAIGTVPTDLVLGLVGVQHPMHGWLLEHGAAPEQLARLRADPARIDVLGVNYYPDLSPRTLVADGTDVVQIATDRWTDGLVTSLRRFEARYGLPMMVTETSIEGTDEVRTAWVRDSVHAVQKLVAGGMDLRGYTWWPLFDFVDWSYASGGRNVEEFAVPDEVVAARVVGGRKTPSLRRMGLVRLEEQADGSLQRVPTGAAAAFGTETGAPANRLYNVVTAAADWTP
ncbi:family 1 glycosylhydrolase [Curtobacterium sp. MCBD17_028]|uniref:family 1 glycosylhydrolase n=1 Tax=Curtobacterium sp. MCBD17_028 TaxID=2175670 RepID=UPI000DA9121C|nr:family 1 glycosylhydrolase [Curtobacterium sp. MCBD17_028]PZE26028.1 hypothetical protein DEI86_09340 [Curtobacterium sp. MCBD17_028]